MNKRREGQSTVVVRLRENAALEKPRKQQNGDYHQDDYHQYVNQVVRTHVCISSLGSVCIRCTAASMVRDNHWCNSQNSLYTRSPPEKPIAPLRFGPGATVWWRTSGGYYGEVSAGFDVEAARVLGRGRAAKLPLQRARRLEGDTLCKGRIPTSDATASATEPVTLCNREGRDPATWLMEERPALVTDGSS